MKKVLEYTLAVPALFLSTNSAWAFNFGFARAPDWMDPYFTALIALALPFFIATALTKPGHVPFNELYRTKVEPLPTFFFRMCQVIVGSIALLFLVGMWLARA